MEFRNDIQGLRAIAVFLVFIFHLSSNYLPGGFIGVDIFFVISGYLVSSIILHKINKGTFSLVSFYESRIKRIVPAYYFMLAIVAVLVGFVFISSDAQIFRRALMWSIAFLSNNHFANLDNYFGASSNENPLLHTWTLGVEMQFYFILPLLLLFIKGRKSLIAILSIVTVGLFIYGSYMIYKGNSDKMYFSLFARMPEFLLGAIAAIINIRDTKIVKNNSLLLSSIGLIIIIISPFAFNKNTPFPGAMSIIPCFGALLILISNINPINSFLSNKVFVYLGEISYSVYLWHWPVMALMRYYTNDYDFNLIETIVVILATAILSLISYYGVEKALRATKGFKFYIPFGALGLVTCIMFFAVLHLNNKVFGNSSRFMAPSFGLASHAQTFTEVEEFGDTTKNSQILFIGDSHALTMKNYIDVIADSSGFSFETVTNNRYPTIPGLTSKEIKEEVLLNQYNNLIPHVVSKIKDAKLIILMFHGDGSEWKSQIIDLINNLKNSQKLLVLEDFPTLDKNPVRFNRAIVKDEEIEQVYKLNYNPLNNEIEDLLNSTNKTKYLKLSSSKVFENAPFFQDSLMYYDQGHLNEYGSKVFALDTKNQFLNAISWGLN